MACTDKNIHELYFFSFPEGFHVMFYIILKTLYLVNKSKEKLYLLECIVYFSAD